MRAQHALQRLDGLLDAAMDAIITIDEEQRIVQYNPAAEHIFGWTAAQMLGKPLTVLMPERFHAAHAGHIRQFGAVGATSRRMGRSSVVHGLRADGSEFPMDASISQLSTPQGRLYTVILRDVTERQLAEQEHRRLTQRLAGLLESAMDAIITIDEDQRIVLYNRAAEKIFGWSGEAMLGQPLDKLLPSQFRQGHGAHVRHFAATGTTSRRMGDGTVVHGLRANGEQFPMEASISQLQTADGKLFTVILRDITQRVQAQRELQAFAAESHALREGEKSRVARELHDELAQSLTALKMDANWLLERAPPGDEPARAKLASMLAMLDAAVAATRRIAADLRPLMLDDLGLGPAVEWLASSFTQRTGVPVRLFIADEVELQDPYATALFRIVQESLANVAKHAQASEVELRIDKRDGQVRLDVRDNGRGFATGAPRKPQSLGLMGLRERAQLLQGSISVASAPGQGTHIAVRIPLQPQEARP